MRDKLGTQVTFKVGGKLVTGVIVGVSTGKAGHVYVQTDSERKLMPLKSLEMASTGAKRTIIRRMLERKLPISSIKKVLRSYGC